MRSMSGQLQPVHAQFEFEAQHTCAMCGSLAMLHQFCSRTQRRRSNEGAELPRYAGIRDIMGAAILVP